MQPSFTCCGSTCSHPLRDLHQPTRRTKQSDVAVVVLVITIVVNVFVATVVGPCCSDGRAYVPARVWVLHGRHWRRTGHASVSNGWPPREDSSTRSPYGNCRAGSQAAQLMAQIARAWGLSAWHETCLWSTRTELHVCVTRDRHVGNH